MNNSITVCKLVRNALMKKDPHCFQNNTLCKCSFYCYVKFEDDKNFFPKNYDELNQVMKRITSDNSTLKKN